MCSETNDEEGKMKPAVTQNEWQEDLKAADWEVHSK